MQSIRPYVCFDTHIAIPKNDKLQLAYALNMAFFGIFDINDAYGIWHMSCLDMAIWVSKDALLPQECRQMKQCMNGFNGLKSENTDFQNFPLYFCEISFV